MDGKDRERDIRILQAWSRINRNRDPCSVWVYLRGELGKTLGQMDQKWIWKEKVTGKSENEEEIDLVEEWCQKWWQRGKIE